MGQVEKMTIHSDTVRPGNIVEWAKASLSFPRLALSPKLVLEAFQLSLTAHYAAVFISLVPPTPTPQK